MIANIAIKQSVKFHKILGLTYPDIKITNITINLNENVFYYKEQI